MFSVQLLNCSFIRLFDINKTEVSMHTYLNLLHSSSSSPPPVPKGGKNRRKKEKKKKKRFVSELSRDVFKERRSPTFESFSSDLRLPHPLAQ